MALHHFLSNTPPSDLTCYPTLAPTLLGYPSHQVVCLPSPCWPISPPALHYPFRSRLKPIQKMEGVANGVAVGQQSTGLSDISAQVQQYQQFLGESRWAGQGRAG